MTTASSVVLGAVFAMAAGAALWLGVRRAIDRRAFAASRRWFESLIDRTSDLIVVVDAGWTIRNASSVAPVLVGYDPHELLGQQVDLLIAPVDRASVLDDLRRLVTERSPAVRREASIAHRDGHSVPVAMTAHNLLDDPAIHGIVVNLRDLTVERRNEQGRRDTEERYRAILDSLPVMVYSVEPEPPYRPTYISLGHETLGYSRREWMSEDSLWVRSLHPDDRDRVLRGAEDALRARHDFDATYRALAKNGNVRWLRDRGRFLYDPSGRATAWLGYMQDVTELIDAERALRASEERYRDMFEGDVSANFVSTPDGRILNCNAAFLDLFGLASLDEARHTGADRFYVDPGDRAPWLARLQHTGKVEFAEHHLKRTDGRMIQVVENARGYFDADGRLVEVHGHITDVTEQRVLQDQLRQSQKLEAIGRLAGGVAHDFNNLLNVIAAYATLVGEALPPEHPSHGDIAEIGKSVARGATLTRQLLTFSRHRVPELVHIPVDDAIRAAESMLRRVIPPEIDFQLRLDAPDATVFVDAAHVDQILVNLVINAADAMPNGGGLAIETECVTAGDPLAQGALAQPGEYVRLTVRDTGMGMDPATVARAMEPFFTTKERTGGSGLGLATVYGIVHQAGGNVRITSAPGAGTSALVWLPRSDGSGSLPVPPGSAGVLPVARGTDRRRILVVDDEPALLRSLERMLTLKGYIVTTARDGAAALAHWDTASGAFDLVVSDVRMPEMSGIALVRTLRERGAQVPVLLISGYPEDSAGIPGSGADGLAFLEKPFSMSVLLGRVQQLLPGAG